MLRYDDDFTVAVSTMQIPEFAYRTFPRSHWDTEPIPRRECVYALEIKPQRHITEEVVLHHLRLDDHIKTYLDLDALFEMEVMAGTFGLYPILIRPRVVLRDLHIWCPGGLPGADLRGAELINCSIRCSLEGADLRGADLSQCIFHTCCMDGADLRDASLPRGGFKAVFMNEHTNFTGAHFEPASWHDPVLDRWFLDEQSRLRRRPPEE
jgi:hypothetical protein